MTIENLDVFQPLSCVRWPIVLCLNVSPHMKKYAERLNEVLEAMINEISQTRRINSCADVALITYSTDLTVSEFKLASEWKNCAVSVSDCGHGDIVKAIVQAVDTIKKRMDVLDENEFECYTPLLIVVDELEADIFHSISDYDRERFLKETLPAFNGFDKITAFMVDLKGSENAACVNEEIKEQIIVLQENDAKDAVKRVIKTFYEFIFSGMRDVESAYRTMRERIVKNWQYCPIARSENHRKTRK